MADVVFSAKLALRTMPAQPPLKARSGTLPNEAYCHVCLTEEKHAIYAWRDHGRRHANPNPAAMPTLTLT